MFVGPLSGRWHNIVGFVDTNITLFSCYQPYHSDSISDTASLEIIKLNLLC